MELAELLVQEGVAAPPDEIREVLESAQERGCNLVQALVDEHIVVEDVLAEVLARAYGTVVVDLGGGFSVDDEAPQLVSSALARTHLALPVAMPSGGKVKVAFANPLDDLAAEGIEAATGTPVMRVVATLSAVKAEIDRAYRGRTTQVVAGAAPIKPEITRRVQAAPRDDADSGPGTSPLHRLEQSATIEQRHEALLLALVEKGLLTRADYLASLQRLLSGREKT